MTPCILHVERYALILPNRFAEVRYTNTPHAASIVISMPLMGAVLTKTEARHIDVALQEAR